MKAFVIYLPDRIHSVKHSEYMINTLNEYGIDASLFQGISGDKATQLAAKAGKTLYPYSIKSRKLSDLEIKKLLRKEYQNNFLSKHYCEIYERQLIGNDRDKMELPGVVGCFYSHYALWQKCVDLNEPIMIFEDDVKFYRNYQPVEFEGVLILSLGKTSFLKEPWKTYLENPSGNPYAAKWTNFSLPGASGYAIKPDAAKGLIKFYKPYWYPADNAVNHFVCPLQIHNYLMGRNTLPEEGNISMTRSKDWVQCE